MPPRTRTSAGLETPEQTLERSREFTRTPQVESPVPEVNAEVATSQTPNQVANRGVGIDTTIPDNIPSTTLQGDTNLQDVFAQRDQLEAEQQNEAQFDEDLNALNQRIGTVQATPLQDPEGTLNRLLLNRPTDAQTELDSTRESQAEQTRGFATGLEETADEVGEEFALPELQSNLADTRNRIAERQTQLRQTLRDFETNAKRRGVDRRFVEAEKQKVQADAAAELADLAIIENAQLGNLNEARNEVDRQVALQAQAFELENEAIEQEIARLESINTREAEVRSEQLQIALNERERNIEQNLADEKQKREAMLEAAANGADQGTLDAIRNATTAEEATFLAAPFIGRLDRLQAESSLLTDQAQRANIFDQIEQRKRQFRKAAQEAGTEEEAQRLELVAETEQALELKTLAEQLKKSSGLSSAVGFGFGKSVIGSIPFISGDAISGTARADFEALAERAANLLTLDNLDLMSGVLSETDIKILESAGSNLRNFDQSEEQFLREVDRVISTMNRTIKNNGVTPEQATYFGIIDEEEAETFNSIYDSL